MLKKILFIITVTIALLLTCLTILSLIHDVSYWFIKALDFPRLQVLIASLVVLVLFLWMNPRWTAASTSLAAILVVSIGIQASFILPYTPVYDKVVPTIEEKAISRENSISILVANVWMKNRKSEAFLEMVHRVEPDLVLAMETDAWWVEKLSSLKKQYPYSMEYPLENTYGMALYSKIPLKNGKVLFLHHDDVPSFQTEVTLRNGGSFVFYGVHPVPPKPSEYPDNVGEEEVALLRLGKMIANDGRPAVVAGDFNDVAWSNTSRLFGTRGKLHDTRIGRGLYNSFDATSLFMRWPLDHVYVTRDFGVIAFDRLEKFGSDHFPIYAQLMYIEETP